MYVLDFVVDVWLKPCKYKPCLMKSLPSTVQCATCIPEKKWCAGGHPDCFLRYKKMNQIAIDNHIKFLCPTCVLAATSQSEPCSGQGIILFV